MSTNTNLPLINEQYKSMVYLAAFATGVAVTAVLSPWEATRIIGTTVLTGVSYGVANDMIACRDCIEYFTVGHQYDAQNLRNRPLNTLNPTLNAIAWGMIATWHVCAVAGVVLAAIARTPFPGMALKITAAQLAPVLIIGALATFVFAHISSRIAQKKMQDHPHQKYWGVPTEFQAGWEACNIRNSAGYSALAIGGLLLSIGMVAVRAGVLERIR
ncbi:MAG: hypothetical protein JSR58_07435 [Verrucomicrobia bacterium]|nr:hypothetical protein [Verrucomicrobiota bacterium]